VLEERLDASQSGISTIIKSRKSKKKVPNLYDSELFPSMYLVEISGIEPLTS